MSVETQTRRDTIPEVRLLALSLVFLGGAIGAVLLVADAPTWVYYVASIAGLPALFWIAPAIEASQRPLRVTAKDELASADEPMSQDWLARHREQERNYAAETALRIKHAAENTALAAALGSIIVWIGIEVVAAANQANSEKGRGSHHTVESSSGGGSSPVVPILIAVTVLAAISIGVVLYRQREVGRARAEKDPHHRPL